VGMDYKPANKGLTYGSTVTLTNNYSPGNWGWLNVPLGGFQGSNDPTSANNLSAGGANTLAANIQHSSNTPGQRW